MFSAVFPREKEHNRKARLATANRAFLFTIDGYDFRQTAIYLFFR